MFFLCWVCVLSAGALRCSASCRGPVNFELACLLLVPCVVVIAVLFCDSRGAFLCCDSGRVQEKKAGDPPRPALKPKRAAAAEDSSAAASSSEVAPPPAAPQAPAPKARGKAKAKAKAAPRIRKVLITAIETPKRGRGRPVGSLGKKKRDLMVEEALRRQSTVA